MVDLQALTFSHDYTCIRPSFRTPYDIYFYFFAWLSLSGATTNLSQESTWTSVVFVAGTRLRVSQSEEELNGHRLSLNGSLVTMKCTYVLTDVLFLICTVFHKLKDHNFSHLI